MTRLTDYAAFGGRHPETGSVHDVLAYHGARMPHSGAPPSEAFLLGVSGGIVVGCFQFDYGTGGRLLSLLPRNTFDPLETMLDRLGIVREVRQTTEPARAEANLEAALAAGEPVIVWADRPSLASVAEPQPGWWSVEPVVVFGLDDDSAWLADGSSRPHLVPRTRLAAARGRIGKERHRQMTLGGIDPDRVPEATLAGIRQSVRLFFEPPPKGAPTNFGLEALKHLAAMLVNTRNVRGWARFFPPGPDLWGALFGTGFNPGLVGWIGTWGFGDGMERGAYADFLEEAADILARPALRQAAERFRESRVLWLDLVRAAAPSDAPALHEAGELVLRRHALWRARGADADEEIRAIDDRLRTLAGDAAQAFPVDDRGAADLLRSMSAVVEQIVETERVAFDTLRAATR